VNQTNGDIDADAQLNTSPPTKSGEMSEPHQSVGRSAANFSTGKAPRRSFGKRSIQADSMPIHAENKPLSSVSLFWEVPTVHQLHNSKAIR
jgi:hypothetical protein